uniref:class I SAM-dependent RNA methyltransferase n=1 Tax=Candidatus Ventrenecus sp. TaxID=3085654 RepID=UPI003FEFFC4E
MKVRIEKFDYEGRGLCHIDGKVTFVPKTLKGEVVDISLEKSEKHYNVAKLNEIIEKSPERIPSFCPYSSLCGGCAFSHLSYENSLKYKKEMISDLFRQNNISFPLLEMVPSRPVLGYRNKVSLKVQKGKFGYYEEQSHCFLPIQNCYLLDDALQSLLRDFALFHFQNGELVIQTNSKGDILLNIKTQDEISILEELTQKHSIKGILLNNKLVYGTNTLEEERGNIHYRYSFHSFFQVNAYISEKIKEDVMDYVRSKDEVYDLYCGVGFFSLPLALRAKSVIGIEENKEAILMALENARLNHIENVSFNVGKVEEILPKVHHDITLALVDPPRSGLKPIVIKTLVDANIPKILYISCHPLTLVRDLKEFTKYYEIESIKLYDMFAYSKHVECLCVLERK